ncbi:MAG: hypothetical protein IKH16_12020 [Selenomonadaceae bacterium]|nr:hypothetical protein [Selenomonadaceae bacterium]MBR4694870.1 hypothetical protein [Selenomonadaceae bacterium]
MEHFADIKVKVVDSFPDLKVKVVDSFPDDIGEWKKAEEKRGKHKRGRCIDEYSWIRV